MKPETTVKSCFNCQHLHRWSYPATLYEPPDDGWECKHPQQNQFPDADIDDITPNPNCQQCHGSGYIGYSHAHPNASKCGCWDDTDDLLCGKFYAANCPGYQFFDWEENDRLQVECEEKMEQQLFLTPSQEAELNDIRESNEQQRLHSLGLIDENGQPTDEYYQLSEQKYDARR